MELSDLRPVERRVLKWRRGLVDGTPREATEVAAMFRRAPGWVERVERLAALREEQGIPHQPRPSNLLSPKQRRVLRLRLGLNGEARSADEVARMFSSTERWVHTVERGASWLARTRGDMHSM